MTVSLLVVPQKSHPIIHPAQCLLPLIHPDGLTFQAPEYYASLRRTSQRRDGAC